MRSLDSAHHHPNMLALLAYRLRTGIPDNALVFLRVNEDNPNVVDEKDYEFARALTALFARPLETRRTTGMPDFSTIHRNLLDKGNGIVEVRTKRLNIPLLYRRRNWYVPFFDFGPFKWNRPLSPVSDFNVVAENVKETIRSFDREVKDREGYSFYVIYGDIRIGGEDSEYNPVLEDLSAEGIGAPRAAIVPLLPERLVWEEEQSAAQPHTELYVFHFFTSKYSIPVLDEFFKIPPRQPKKVNDLRDLIPNDVIEDAI